MKLIFLVPVFNESLNIPELAETLTNSCREYDKHYLFVDDGSTDNTIDLLKHHFPAEQLSIIQKRKNKGPGDSFNLGFNWILDRGYLDTDLVITLEGDNTSDPAILPEMVSIASLGFPMVLASVYAQGGGLDKTNLIRRFVSFVANILMRMVFDIKVLTLSSFYRVYQIGLIRKIRESYGSVVDEPGFISKIEILVKAIRLNTRIIEVPMTLHSQKRKGKSKMKVFKTSLKYVLFLIRSKRISPQNHK